MPSICLPFDKLKYKNISVSAIPKIFLNGHLQFGMKLAFYNEIVLFYVPELETWRHMSNMLSHDIVATLVKQLTIFTVTSAENT